VKCKKGCINPNSPFPKTTPEVHIISSPLVITTGAITSGVTVDFGMNWILIIYSSLVPFNWLGFQILKMKLVGEANLIKL
jgi:hypothetical protein